MVQALPTPTADLSALHSLVTIFLHPKVIRPLRAKSRRPHCSGVNGSFGLGGERLVVMIMGPKGIKVPPKTENTAIAAAAQQSVKHKNFAA